MSAIVRFGVSIGEELLRKFDVFSRAGGYGTRPEAPCDLIRDALIGNMGAKEHPVVSGTLTLVYDQRKSDPKRKPAAVQHDAHHLALAAPHVHPDHDNCPEVFTLREKNGEVRALAASVLAVKGVKHGGSF